MGKVLIIKNADFSANSFAQDEIIEPLPMFYQSNVSASEGAVTQGAYMNSRFWYPVSFEAGKKYKLTMHVIGTNIDVGQTELVAVRAVDNNTASTGDQFAFLSPSDVADVSNYTITSEITMSTSRNYLYILLIWGRSYATSYPTIDKVYIQEVD